MKIRGAPFPYRAHRRRRLRRVRAASPAQLPRGAPYRSAARRSRGPMASPVRVPQPRGARLGNGIMHEWMAAAAPRRAAGTRPAPRRPRPRAPRRRPSALDGASRRPERDRRLAHASSARYRAGTHVRRGTRRRVTRTPARAAAARPPAGRLAVPRTECATPGAAAGSARARTRRCTGSAPHAARQDILRRCAAARVRPRGLPCPARRGCAVCRFEARTGRRRQRAVLMAALHRARAAGRRLLGAGGAAR